MHGEVDAVKMMDVVKSGSVFFVNLHVLLPLAVWGSSDIAFSILKQLNKLNFVNI